MKLLFDANLSPAVVKGLSTEYPNSSHVRDAGLWTASDADIWTYAKANEFAIVSKDSRKSNGMLSGPRTTSRIMELGLTRR